MSVLTREAILAADDLPREAVDVPEWGGAIHVRSMTGAERDRWEAGLVAAGDVRNMENVRARLVALTAVDANGVRLFSDEDAAALGGKSARALDRVFAAAMRLNAIGRQEVERLAGE